MKGLFIFGFLIFHAIWSFGQKVTTLPTFRVNFSGSSALATPTADKPQSKLWFMDASWWALLPDSSGPTLWQRTPDGWRAHGEIKNNVQGLPGRADVWYENRVVTAVGVSDSSLCVFRMSPRDPGNEHWQAEVLAWLPMPRKEPHIETATIAKDAAGVWWVAADVGKDEIYVWSSKDAVRWVSILVGNGVSPDDISSIAALKDAVVVVWSNQKTEAVYSRKHPNGQPANAWSAIQTVASGEKTADDHLHAALSANGSLWVATKNSLDEVGRPQLVLRVRGPEGGWKNYPYLNLGPFTGPSRPVVMMTPDPTLILSGYTVYDHSDKERYHDRIVFGRIDTTSKEVLVDQQEVIAPDTALKIMVNNITGPKAAFPSDGPWIILASDEKGNIYEADLRTFFGPAGLLDQKNK